jgi:hypothetical protein
MPLHFRVITIPPGHTDAIAWDKLCVKKKAAHKDRFKEARDGGKSGKAMQDEVGA